jgi:tRNA uridine 5-carbamoylmethylation protein Kti12
MLDNTYRGHTIKLTDDGFQIYFDDKFLVGSCCLVDKTQNAKNLIDARNLKKDKIIQYIDRLRADTRRLTSESVSKEVEKLDTLYLEAREKKQYTAAVNAIRLKSQLLGFLIEKKEVQHSTLDAMSDDDLSKYLDQIKQEHEIN